MHNITITLDEETARWARLYAAERNASVSRVVGEMLREKMLEARDYNESMRRFLGKAPRKLGRGEPYPTRDSLHDRTDLR